MTALRTSAAAAVALACLCVLAACERRDTTPADPPAAPAPTPAPAPPPRVQLAALTRPELIQAMDAAASAFAEGRAAPPSPRLAGRQFTLVQAFGCAPPGDTPPAPGVAGVSRSIDGALVLALTPADWAGMRLIEEAAPDAEAVEGIWLTRPWLHAAVCPTTPVDPLAPAAATPQTYGLAVVFPEGGSRILRRGARAYSHAVRAGEGGAVQVPSGGYRLVVSGRLAAFADGRAIRCAGAGPDLRPTCLAAVEIDQVAFTDAAGATLSAWRN